MARGALEEEPQDKQRDNDGFGQLGHKLGPAVQQHTEGPPRGGEEDEEAPRPAFNEWVLMQIVESAESKLMRGGQQAGLSDGQNRKWWEAAANAGGSQEMTNRRPQVNSGTADLPAFGASRDDGPTPTNQLVRTLISKDRRALLGAGDPEAPTSSHAQSSWRHLRQPASPSKQQQLRADRKRESEVACRLRRPPAAAADASDATAGEWTDSEQQQGVEPNKHKVELNNLTDASNMDRLHGAGGGPLLNDLSAIISKCHTSLQLTDSRPYRLAKRALRSVSPRRPGKSGSLSGVPAPPSLPGSEEARQPRRHSTYLFPNALAGLHAKPEEQVSSSSSSDLEDNENDTMRAANMRHLFENHRHHRYDKEEEEEEYVYEDEGDIYGINRGGQLGLCQPASHSLKLRNSASSPSALSTPTNQDWQVSCQEPCCLPSQVASSKADYSHLSHLHSLQLHSMSSAAKTSLRDKGGPRGSGPHRKRHSLINVLQAGAGSASRRLNPRSLFAGAAGGGSPPNSLNNARAEARSSLDCSIGSRASGELYDPLIPESGFKIVVMGTSGSGKTSIIRRFLYNSFSERHNPTVEDTYFVEFPYMKNIINISISDTSGTYQFPAMRKLAINSGDAFILVYSVDSPQSFDELEQLRQNILEERELAYLEGPASGTSSLTSNDSLGGSSQRSSIGSVCVSHQLQPLQEKHPVEGQPPASAISSCVDGTGGDAELTHTESISGSSRYWSLGSIFSHHSSSNPQHPNQTMHHHHHHQQPPPTNQIFVQCRNSSISSSSICSSSCSSSADNSRRSSISAAEAALKTRRTRRPPMVIVANKLDLPADKHLVNSDEMEALAVIDWNNGFVRASAALNINIEDIFQQVLRQAKQPPTLTQAIVSKRRKSLPPKFPLVGGK